MVEPSAPDIGPGTGGAPWPYQLGIGIVTLIGGMVAGYIGVRRQIPRQSESQESQGSALNELADIARESLQDIKAILALGNKLLTIVEARIHQDEIDRQLAENQRRYEEGIKEGILRATSETHPIDAHRRQQAQIVESASRNADRKRSS